ncbi:C-terminal domain of homeodomain 1-domain-containing protein [Boletus reticuloceps]|uniref:C-terminal domain of homeodomain 1-domain-containing protein n=1 Tax=Boletus reticuloceps TaxID=495285 RepID=A0A8I3AFV4_9AGAM|nr:C-terminal domain of homeodomain 1-domain-containing protein [Boletus reticuloceps]
MALLQDDFWPALFHDDTGCGAIVDTHSIVSRSSYIASCFLELEKVNQDFESKLRNDFNNILNSMDGLSLSPTPQPPSNPPPPTRTVSSIHNSSFTIEAYSWLLKNIANPYPSLAVKTSLAQQHNCTLSAVNTWFINARRRIGWTTLCRDYFHNCRADALDAACRALVDEDPDRPLPPNVVHAFVGVKATADSLYSSAFPKSAFAHDIDVVTRNMTDQDIKLMDERRHCELEGMVESSEASETESQNQEPVLQHHSPDSSCFSSPVPLLDESLTDDSEEEDVLPPILAGRKRRLSCSEPAHATTLSTKRKRHMCPTTCPSVETWPSSSEESLENIPHNQQPSTVISQNSKNISASPKRRLSDVDDTGMRRRLQESIAEPYLHSVSYPLPLSTSESEYSIDEWFNSNFDALFTLPPPVDVIEPDLSAQWEVELFSDYTIPPEEPQRRPLKSLNSPDTNQTSTSVDPLALDDILQSLKGGGYVVAPPEFMDPAVILPAADSVPQYFSLSPEPIDWTALLSWPTSEPSLDSIFGQSHTDSLPLPEIDFSILQLP